MADGAPTSLDEPLIRLGRRRLQPTETVARTEATQQRDALLPFVVISSTYLLFTITDGALRMIVLLHAYRKSFTAMEVTLMFVLYELAGVGTNLAAGIAGARWGIRATLVTGLLLQIVTFGLLFGWEDGWSKSQAILYVTGVQLFGGVAKDLTKLGGKTVTKLVTPEEKETQLFKLVSLLTGWKNSLKGVGYFLGSWLIGISYGLALGAMMALVLLALPMAYFGLDPQLGVSPSPGRLRLSDVFDRSNPNLNWLSLARLFLFASRDFWFEVPLPFFLRSPPCAAIGRPCADDSDCGSGTACDAEAGACANLNPGGGCGGLGWSRTQVGALLALYIIMYGQFQAYTPQLVTGPLRQTPPNKRTEVLWGLVNCLPTLVMAVVAAASADAGTYSQPSHAGLPPHTSLLGGSLVGTIACFALVFAVNSSIHSYLVVLYAASDKVAASVGFYYMANACGRLLGTLGSGVLYTYVGDDLGLLAGTNAVQGLAACFAAATASSLLAALITLQIDDGDAALLCGPCCVLYGGAEAPASDQCSRLHSRAEADEAAAGRLSEEEVVRLSRQVSDDLE
mmetsp:Transcript_37845/g.121389  ORF Transcript_37845/g.121389 Transcript_37845/m.121389 type:complete len:567 (-) Transcript_37845:2162-3862(-)